MSTFPPDAQLVRTATPIADARVLAFSGSGAAMRVANLRRALDQALVQWWQRNVLPAPGLVRDGLLALEAGHDLDDAQRSLLLRAALARGQGMVTALHHQTDPDRTALLLRDALLDAPAPLSLATFAMLGRDDEMSDAWLPALCLALREEAADADPVRGRRAALLLSQIEGRTWSEIDKAAAKPPRRRTVLPLPLFMTVAALAVIVMAAAVGLWILLSQPKSDLVDVPAGVYRVANLGVPGELATITLPAFRLDRTEVTNAAYRRCVAAGECPWPAGDGPARHSFLDPAFDALPVANVSWAAAAAYCTYRGQRLPTAAEWEIGAGFAPATGRYYRYPWGDLFQPQVANNATNGDGTARPVGSFHPQGSSPLGVADMAGNVAEWTATAAVGAGQVIVKGGSFQSPPTELEVHIQTSQAKSAALPWLGFRCAQGS